MKLPFVLAVPSLAPLLLTRFAPPRPPPPPVAADPAELTDAEIARYSRHLILEDVGVAGQRRLKASSVAVVGAGGLGSPALLHVGRADISQTGRGRRCGRDADSPRRQVAATPRLRRG